MALDLSKLPDQSGQPEQPPKLNLNALPDQAPQPQGEAPNAMLNKVASGIESVTGPLGRAVERVMAPVVRTAIDITKLPDRVPTVVKPLAQAAVAPIDLGVKGLQAAGAVFEGLDKGGEIVAEKLGEKGYPIAGAALGTGISKGLDIYATLSGGGAILKSAGKAAAKKAALKNFNLKAAPEIAKLPPQPNLIDVPTSAKPTMKLERLQAATKDPVTGDVFVGHRSGPIQKKYNDMLKAGNREEAQAFLKSELEKKGFTTAEGEFISPDEALARIEGQGKEAGPAFARELPFASTRTGITPKPTTGAKGIELSRKDVLEINKKAKTNLQVPEEQLELPLGEVGKGRGTKPFTLEPKAGMALLPGATDRVVKIGEMKTPDVSKIQPTTSRVEFNKQLGDAERTAYDQYQMMGKQANLADASTTKIRAESTPGFKPNSLESETLFNYLESPNKAEFLSRLAEIDAQLVSKLQVAEPRVRAAYDQLLTQVNEVRVAEGIAPIKRRENYVTHFQEMSILDDLGKLNMADTPEAQEVVARVMADSQQLASSAKYSRVRDITFRHIRRMMGEEFDKDAVTALSRYARSANRYIHMQPVVNELNLTAEALKPLNPGAAKYLADQADFLAGKVQFVDQAAEDLFGKEGVKLVHEISQRAKGNVLLGNVNTVLHQGQGLVPTVSDNSLTSVAKAAGNLFSDEMDAFVLANSPVIESRAIDAASRQVGAGPIRTQLQGLLSQADYQVAKLAWLSRFHEGLAKKLPVQDAIKGAEEFAAMSQGHTSLVNTPPLLRSKMSQEMLAFQNQALANTKYLVKHIWKGKSTPEIMAAATKMGVMMYVLQELEQQVTGKGKRTSLAEETVPLASSVSRGFSGPGLSVISGPIKAKTPESFLRQIIRSAFLVQKAIPAGAAVGKMVTDAVLGEPKRGKR